MNATDYIAKRKKDLGIADSVKVEPSTKAADYVQKRKAEISMKPEIYSARNARGMAEMDESRLVNESRSIAPKIVANTSKEPVEPIVNRIQKPNVLDKIFKDNPVARVLNYPFAKAAEHSIPDAPLIGKREDGSYGNIPGTNVRKQFATENPVPSTGNKTADKVGNFLGEVGSYFTPVGSKGTGVQNVASDIVSKLGFTNRGMKIEEAIGKLGSNAVSKINPYLAGQGVQLSQNLGSKVAQNAARGAADFGIANPLHTLQTTDPTAKDLALSAGEGVVGGAVLGGGLSALGYLGKTALEQLGKNTDRNLGISAFGKRAGQYDNLSTDTKSQLVTSTKAEKVPLRDSLDSGYRKITDDLYRFKDFDKHAEKTLGRKLEPSEQSHTLALNSRGSDMISNHILREDLVDINGNVIGKSLKNATEQIPKNKLVDFEDYQVLRHSMTRMNRNEKVYRDELEMTPDKAAQKVAEYESQNPQFRKIADELYSFRENLTKTWLVDTGLVSRQNWDGIRENNPFYVPNNRQFSNLEKGGGAGKANKGFARQTSPLKPAPGSQRKIISPTESDITHVDQYVKAGKRNQVMQNIVKLVQNDPEKFEGFVELVPMTDNIKQSELKKFNEIIAKDGVEGLVENLNNHFDDLFNQAKATGRKDLNNVIPVMFNGEPVLIKVNDAPLLEAMTNLTPQAQGVIVEAARQATRVMKMLTTGVNPVFSITRNLIRDIPMSYVASKSTDNPLRFSWDLLDSVVSILANKELYKSFKSVGGGHSSSIAADRNLLAQNKRDILPQKPSLKNVGGKVLGAVENFTNALETAPRLGEYKRITKAGNNSPDSKIKGLFEANDVTVNFKRRGNVGREIDAFLPYFNAAIQGLDKTLRTAKDRPVAAATKAVAAITVPTILLYSINHNNPDYQKLDDRTKDLYYLIPNGDGTFQKYPKPREFGVVFGSGVERALRKWKDQDPEAFAGFAENARVAFSPPGISGLTKPGSLTDKLEGATIGDSILGPLSDIKSNQDFAGRPIVPRYMEGGSPELQYDDRTSNLSRWIGEKIHQSPKQLDYLLKSYTGIVGQLGIPLNSDSGSLKKALVQQVTADPTYSNNTFTKFYDAKEKLDGARKDSLQTGKISKDLNEQARQFMDRASDDVSKVRKAMRDIQSNKAIPTAEKEQKLKELQVLMTSIADNANRVLDKATR